VSDAESPVHAAEARADGGPVTAAVEGKRERRWLRIVLLVAVLVALYVVGKTSGVIDSVDVETVRRTVDEAGALGVVIFVVIFAVGELLHVPGIVFVVAGLLAWGRTLGFAFGMVGSLVSVSLSFFVVRGVGGRALASIERPIVKRMLARLDARPIQTVFLLRLLLFLAPALNYGLALTRVRYRDYLAGSALGLAIPLALVALLFDWVLRTFFS
jgi:uncharacterized membrane protein YdjX (TVP38/TMEM64 family)